MTTENSTAPVKPAATPNYRTDVATGQIVWCPKGSNVGATALVLDQTETEYFIDFNGLHGARWEPKTLWWPIINLNQAAQVLVWLSARTRWTKAAYDQQHIVWACQEVARMSDRQQAWADYYAAGGK